MEGPMRDAQEDPYEAEFQAMEQEVDELYDSGEDDLDMEYRENERLFHSSSNSKEHGTGQIESDGCLSCPACFSVLSYECERHVEYRQQWRSVHPINTTVNYTYTIKFEPEEQEEEAAEVPGEIYYPVYCVNCQLNVAVIDSEDVYHFFDVIFEPK